MKHDFVIVAVSKKRKIRIKTFVSFFGKKYTDKIKIREGIIDVCNKNTFGVGDDKISVIAYEKIADKKYKRIS